MIIKYNVDANLDASDKVISGNEPSSDGCLQSKVKNRNEPKQVMPKSKDLSKSIEIKLIWTFDSEFPTNLNKSYITFKSAVKHRQLSYDYPRGQNYPPSNGNHTGYIFQYITHVRFY